jgi:hypothetical protein
MTTIAIIGAGRGLGLRRRDAPDHLIPRVDYPADDRARRPLAKTPDRRVPVRLPVAQVVAFSGRSVSR